METTKTASQILNEAADLLEEEGRWDQRYLFKITEKGCSMCAHGAIAYCGNPKVKEFILNKDRFKTVDEAMLVLGGDTIEEWRSQGGEVGVAHYFAAKNGLTFAFNDHPATTKQDVIHKLREIAKLAV